MATEMSPGARRPVLDFTAPPWRERRRVFNGARGSLSYANFLDRVCDLYGSRTAIVLDHAIDYPGFSGDVLSYRDVHRLVNRFAGALRALGVRRGDRVGLVTMNRIEMAFCNFAAARLGAIPVPMNFMLKPAEIGHVVERAGVELVVVDPFVWENTIREASAVPGVKRWAMIAADEIPADVTSLAGLMNDAPDRVQPVEPASDDEIAMLFFTSGTTGFPKGAMLSHAAATIHLRTHARFMAFNPRLPDRGGLLVMPVAHAAGYAVIMLNLSLGIASFFLSRFDPSAIFEAVERLRPAVFSGTPAMYRMLFAAGAEEHDWSSIRMFGGGADAFDDALVRRVRNLGAKGGPLRLLPGFIRGYGMAEANSYVAQSPPFEAGDFCCGWIMPPVKHRLVDEGGRDVPKGQAGELWIKGPNVAKGYWNDPEATAASFTSDGWFRTGDWMRKGKWRMLYFVGRSADIIKSGGYKISANEIDQALTQHPDVDVSATVGIPHAMKGERPFSAVKLRAGASVSGDEILTWARERIAPYKCPRAIVVVDDIPFTFSMKPKRRAVRETLLRDLPEEVRGA